MLKMKHNERPDNRASLQNDPGDAAGFRLPAQDQQPAAGGDGQHGQD